MTKRNYSRDGKGFRELLVWQRAHELTLAIYDMTKAFPSGEKIWADLTNPSSGIFYSGKYR